MHDEPLATELDDLIATMPKAELHVHLEGTIQPATAVELAKRHGLEATLPTTDPDRLGDWFVFRNFKDFIRVIRSIQDLIRTPDDFALITYEAGADMAEQNIRYREFTVTPYNHTHLFDKGLSIRHVLHGLEEGRRSARADFGVEIRWVFDVPRNFSFSRPGGTYDPEPAEVTLRHALAGQEQGVIGLGIGGDEHGRPPQPFAHAFREAKRAGLKSLPHAGESLRPWGADHVRESIEVLEADRIGHGVGAIRDPHLLALMLDRAIPLEVCPTSNLSTRVCEMIALHPLRHLDRMGLTVTVNSDDPPLFGTTLNNEYRLLATGFGYGATDLVRIARNAFTSAMCQPELRSSLLHEFDAWSRSQNI
ncbi:MAG: adenosine deaminase [bacterium]|nr:adenosine deaminase [bacterium]